MLGSSHASRSCQSLGMIGVETSGMQGARHSPFHLFLTTCFATLRAVLEEGRGVRKMARRRFTVWKCCCRSSQQQNAKRKT
ncbi:hypothetical protein BHM03_00051429 [Ensete ventricosum]|nr:hypothetical protein BHM03_00051429 [Ensete ventricosum]